MLNERQALEAKIQYHEALLATRNFDLLLKINTLKRQLHKPTFITRLITLIGVFILDKL